MAKVETKAVPLNSTLHKLLVEQNMDNFTALELRDRFIGVLENISADDARLYVHRHLARLQKLSLIKKHPSSDGRKAIYRKSEEFLSAQWMLHSSMSSPSRKDRAAQLPTKKLTAELTAKLDQAKKDFVACLEESMTYSALSKQYPIMAEELTKANLLAEQQGAKLIGEIRALKVALKIYD